MKSIHKSKFLTLDLEEKQKLLHFKWLPATEDMDEPDYQKELHTYADAIEAHQIKTVLIDDRQMEFVIAPNLQAWIAQEIFPKVAKAGLKRYAVLLKEDMIAKLAIEQATAETPQGILYRFFEDETEAHNWLAAV